MKKGLLLLFVLLSAIGLRAQDAVVGDTLKKDVTTVLESGKTYILGEQYAMCKVSFTAPADGFLNITPSQKVSNTSFQINGASSTFTKTNGGVEKKGMAKGSVFTGTFYTSGAPSADNTYALTVSFEEGVPYEAITLDEVYPQDGGEWSAAAYYWPNLTTSYQGQPYLKFSTSVNSNTAVASVKIGDKVYTPLKLYVSSQVMTLQSLPDTLKAAIAEGLIKAGDTFTVTLTGVQDKEFAANALADQTFTYTLASTACTGINPAANPNRSVLPEEVVFSFDGNVNIDNAKFYFVNKNSGEKTELTGAVDGTNLTVTVPAIEGLLPKLYDIVAEGVTDANGKVITYGETEGQLTAAYGTSNGHFKPVMEPANNANVSSLKTYTATLPGAVVYDASQASSADITIGKYNEDSWGFDPIEGVTVSYEINENVITFTLSEEITAPGDYRLSVPAKIFWSEELYDKENLSDQTCYYVASQNITCTILPYGPTSTEPANGAMVNKLGVITLAFDEVVDFDEAAVVAVLKQTIDEDDWFGSVKLDTIAKVALDYDYENENNILVNLGNIDSAGTYMIVVPEGSIWATENKNKKIGEWTYTYNVDPDYWDSEWVVEVGENCSEEAPCQLIAGRKYNFTELYSYATFTATENGRVYLTAAEGSDLGDLWMCNADWVRSGTLNSTEDGGLWFGVVAGETYYMTDYGFGSRIIQVTFDGSQSPFDPIAYIGVNPADGGIWSKSVKGQYSYTKGVVEFIFTHNIDLDAAQLFVVLPSKDNKEIDVTDLAYPETGNAGNVNGRYAAFDMCEAIEEVKAQNGLKVGDKVQIVLRNVQDANFADNKLEGEFKVELTLAATVCTSVYPNSEYSGVDAIPTEIELQFDGNVTCTNGKGYIIDVKSGNKQEFTIESLTCESRENWDGSFIYMTTVTLPEATIELTSKKFDIQLEGLVDAEGNTVSYGKEAGKFVINYYFRDDTFKPVSVDPEDESDVESLKTIKLTFDEKVYIAPDAKEPYVWVGDDEVMGKMTVDPADEKSVIITWDKEITQAGAYYPTIPTGSVYNSKFDETKDDYGLADGASYNPYLSYSYYIKADVSTTTVAAITPSTDVPSINKLPAEVVIEFNGNVKEVVTAYGMVNRGLFTVEVPEDAFVLDSKIEDNKVIVAIPQEVIDAVTMGNFYIVVVANGEDGKVIGSIDNPYAENITISYYIWKTLQLVESVPADGETVKELSTIKLTFDAPIFEIDAFWETPCLLNAESWEKVADLAYSFEGSEVTLALAEPVTTEGEYIVYVPAEIIYDESYTTNSEINLYVTVGEAPVENLAIVSATPENGATVANLTTVEFKLNKEVGYLYKGMLIPADGGDDAASASLTQSEADPTSYTLDFTFEGLFANGATLRKGVTYTMELQAYASEEAWQRDGAHETVTLTYVGDAEAFQYSDVTLESITPAENFVISDKSRNKFVVKFSGAVNMVDELTYINMGQGATEKFESIVANADKTEYTLTIAESLLASIRGTVNIVFAANDESGKRVQGNNGEEEYSTFVMFYNTVIGVPDLTVTPDAAAEQASLTTLTISCAEGLVPSWTAGNITLTDADGNAIAIGEPEAVVAEGADEWATPTAWTVALKEELKTVGAYTLTIPAGYFNLGSTQGQVMGSKETVVVFNITAEAQGIQAITVDAEVVVYNIAGVAVAQGKASEVLKSLTKGIYIVNGKKFVVK